MSDDWDVLHGRTAPHLHWTTANMGEALPGVLTPLGWTLWERTLERSTRDTYRASGAFSRSDSLLPPHTEGMTRIFYGRAALLVETVALLGNRLPGTTGKQVVTGLFGHAPDDIDYTSTRRRYPVIAMKLPYQMLSVPRRLRPVLAHTDSWWRAEIAATPARNLSASLDAFERASRRFYRNVLMQSLALFCMVQPTFDALTRLTAWAGVGSPTALASGYGGVPETKVVTDLWRASRNETSLADVVATHGYHGPGEGELSSTVWREDPSPLQRLLGDYAAMPDSASPQLQEAARRAERSEMEQELLVAVPTGARPLTRLLLRRAQKVMPLRGAAKNAFLQAFDVCRASARRAGALLAEDGALGSPEDVFYLTYDELLGLQAVPDVAQIVKLRRERREEYSRIRLPEAWTGEPKPIASDSSNLNRRTGTITGTGVSPGVVEGTVRVVADPAFEDVGTNEILVAATTDPSWSSIMFISSALIVDIGGVMSHAAVVARELGMPCVVNTRDGSRLLRTGDRVRVDGTAGTVEILRH